MADSDPEDDKDKGSSGALTRIIESLIEGGIPQVIAGPAGKAISRLIAGLADIPAAYLEKFSQAIRDQKNARSIVMKAVSEAAASKAIANPEVLERGLNRWVGEICRTQENREAVARKTIQHLENSDVLPPATADGPSDDWMNVFMRHAGDASSESLRDIWGRILAGEIQQPGAFSLRTLQFVSMLNSSEAAIVDKALPYFLDGKFIVTEVADAVLTFEELTFLEEVGVLVSTGFGSSFEMRTDENGYGHIVSSSYIFRLKTTPLKDGKFAEKVVLGCYLLSRTGAELLRLLNVKENPIVIAPQLFRAKPQPEKVEYAPILNHEKAGVRHATWVEVSRPTDIK